MTPLDRAIGEIVYMLPIFAIALFFSMLYPVIVVFWVFPLSKMAYDIPREDWLHLARHICRPLSYGAFIFSGLLSLGISHAHMFLHNQPLIPFYVAVGVGLAWVVASDIQKSMRRKDADIAFQQARICALEAVPEICLKSISEAELRPLCASVGVLGRNQDFAVACFVEWKTCKQLWAEFEDITTSDKAAEQKRRRLRKKLQKHIDSL